MTSRYFKKTLLSKSHFKLTFQESKSGIKLKKDAPELGREPKRSKRRKRKQTREGRALPFSLVSLNV